MNRKQLTALQRCSNLFSWLLICTIAFYPIAGARAQGGLDEKGLELRPKTVVPKSSAEYFSTVPSATIFMPINIWGEVNQPGLHFIPAGANLSHSISAAGGPSSNAAMPDVYVRRGKEEWTVDLYQSGADFKLHQNDTIFVDRSFKSNMPLILSAISTVASIVTLYLVTKDKK